MSSVAKGFSCFVELPVAARVKCDPDLVHGGVWKLVGDAETPKLEDTRLARSVDGGSISMLSVTSKAEDILYIVLFASCSYKPTEHLLLINASWLNFGTFYIHVHCDLSRINAGAAIRAHVENWIMQG